MARISINDTKTTVGLLLEIPDFDRAAQVLGKAAAYVNAQSDWVELNDLWNLLPQTLILEHPDYALARLRVWRGALEPEFRGY